MRTAIARANCQTPCWPPDADFDSPFHTMRDSHYAVADEILDAARPSGDMAKIIAGLRRQGDDSLADQIEVAARPSGEVARQDRREAEQDRREEAEWADRPSGEAPPDLIANTDDGPDSPSLRYEFERILDVRREPPPGGDTHVQADRAAALDADSEHTQDWFNGYNAGWTDSRKNALDGRREEG